MEIQLVSQINATIYGLLASCTLQIITDCTLHMTYTYHVLITQLSLEEQM